MTSPTSIPASHPCLTNAHTCDRSAGGICNATAHRARVPAHHGLADGRPHGGSADNEYVCACMEGYEEKTPHAPSHGGRVRMIAHKMRMIYAFSFANERR